MKTLMANRAIFEKIVAAGRKHTSDIDELVQFVREKIAEVTGLNPGRIVSETLKKRIQSLDFEDELRVVSNELDEEAQSIEKEAEESMGKEAMDWNSKDYPVLQKHIMQAFKELGYEWKAGFNRYEDGEGDQITFDHSGKGDTRVITIKHKRHARID